MLVIAIQGGWLAVAVEAVHEVATVDASDITAVEKAVDRTGPHDRPLPPGVRGRFVRQDDDVLVLDLARAVGP